jgi:NTP pyrophosphatase (non-canonical NTP hydrolase)
MADKQERRAVWLRREGDHVVVLVEECGEFREVIREYDGDPSLHTPFSHIWEDRS